MQRARELFVGTGKAAALHLCSYLCSSAPLASLSFHLFILFIPPFIFLTQTFYVSLLSILFSTVGHFFLDSFS